MNASNQTTDSARNRRFASIAAAIAASAATLAGCASAPQSYLYDNQVYYRAVKDRYPLYVVAVDGSSPAFRPIPISPGDHLLTLDANAVGGLTQPVTKTYPITIEPCTRYYLAAQRESMLSQDWALVVERTFPAGGCDASRERDKARTTSGAGPAAPVSSTPDVVPAAIARTTSR